MLESWGAGEWREGAALAPKEGMMIRRRSFFVVAATIATALVGASASVASSSTDTNPPRARLTLLSLTGRHDVGTVSLHLIDNNRQDPLLVDSARAGIDGQCVVSRRSGPK
jgi:hypothetical protein